MKKWMKNALMIVVLYDVFTLTIFAESSRAYEQEWNRTKWHREARFGMFIHWGAYSVPARGEWVKSTERMTNSEYQTYVDAFRPKNYDPEEWAKLAKRAGMNYAVMTAKHHDGFCLFDSDYTDYKVTREGQDRDYIREYLDAFRKQGLKVGLYYSLIDWHHPDYPNVGNHPMRDEPAMNEMDYDWDRYLDYLHAQVRELMTDYGKIDILWLDYSFDDYSGEKWRASELVSMIRELQPDIIINNRLTINHGVSSEVRESSGYGDFETPEQGIPAEGLMNAEGHPIPWETCLTLNNNWGYSSTDHDWKRPEQIIHALVECVSKDGNLLLNVGPDSQGTIPQPSVEILNQVGEWLDLHGESIYRCGKADLQKPSWGFLTQNGSTIYAHWAHPKIGPINLPRIGEVWKATVLTTGKRAAFADSWWGNRDPGNTFINFREPIHHTYPLPNGIDTVIRLEIREP